MPGFMFDEARPLMIEGAMVLLPAPAPAHRPLSDRLLRLRLAAIVSSAGPPPSRLLRLSSLRPRYR